jgi:general secretion pathway protein L
MEFYLWWVAQMRALAPAFLTRAAGRQAEMIIDIDPPGEAGIATGTIMLRQNGEETPLKALNLNEPARGPVLPTGLRLPHGAVLSREVVLPLAAARDLRSMIGFEMDRLTPFSADEVYWGVSGVRKDRGRAKLSLLLSVVPRQPVEALRQLLAPAGLAPSFILGEAGRINLAMPLALRDRALRAALPALCILLLLACLAAPFCRQQLALDAAAQQIAANAPAARMAVALRRELATASAGRIAIAEARRAGDALPVLAELTTALPDGTWLSDLELKSGDLTFDGQSDNAAQLISRLSATPGLHDPSFTAPVTRTADGSSEIFSLHATAGD